MANSTHLRVSWHGLFTGCSMNDIGNMEVVAEHRTQNTDTSKTILVGFEENQGFLRLNPCLQYNIYLKIFSKKRPAVRRESGIVKYNDMSRLNVAQLYSGLLRDQQFLDRICQKGEGVITIPDPPEGLSKCILSKGEQETALGKSDFIPLKILNPMNKEPLTIRAEVNKIESCPPTSGIRGRFGYLPNTRESVLKLGGVPPVIVITASILGTAFAVALITATICHFKNTKRSEVVGPTKIDDNADYGLYYTTAGASCSKHKFVLHLCKTIF